MVPLYIRKSVTPTLVAEAGEANARPVITSAAMTTHILNRPTPTTFREFPTLFHNIETPIREQMRDCPMPSNGRTLRSTITSDGALQLRMIEEAVPDPTGSQVLISVEASPINPSDLGVLLGPADPSTLAPAADGALDGQVPERAIPILRDRLDKALPCGNEGAGTVVAAGPDAADLLGKSVTVVGGAMWSDYRLVEACLLYTSPSPRDGLLSRMPSSA